MINVDFVKQIQDGIQREETELTNEANGTLSKLMAVLDLIAESPEPLRFSDLLSRADEPRGSLHRHLRQLVGEGLAEVDEDGRYRPGLRLLKLASRAWSSNDVAIVARPHLERLQVLTGETVHLGILRGNEIVYVDKVEANQSVRMYSTIGNASPLYCTGVGKAALSLLGEGELENVLSHIDFKRFTAATIIDRKALVRDLLEVKATGYAFDLEEHERGIRCLAAPVSGRGILGGISVTAPAYRAGAETMEGWRSDLQSVAAAVSSDLAVRLGPRAFSAGDS